MTEKTGVIGGLDLPERQSTQARLERESCSLPYTTIQCKFWWSVTSVGETLVSATYCIKVKVKEVDLYSAFIVVPHTQGAQVRITQCYLEITPYLPLPRKHSPYGASPD